MEVSPIIDEQHHLTAFYVTITHEEAMNCGFYDEDGNLLELEVSAHPHARSILIRGLKISLWDKLLNKMINEVWEEKKIEIVKNALKEGVTIELVSDITGVDESTIEKIWLRYSLLQVAIWMKTN